MDPDWSQVLLRVMCAPTERSTCGAHRSSEHSKGSLLSKRRELRTLTVLWSGHRPLSNVAGHSFESCVQQRLPFVGPSSFDSTYASANWRRDARVISRHGCGGIGSVRGAQTRHLIL